ncbi:MAG TPA: hypothetical protein HA311_06510, partial [Candidatus Poseidoniaceae archaeon]|nr:hypothetical protein [Candidatus Poseidoniaceae archaeon]
MSEAREQAWATVVARSGIRSADEVELRYPTYRRLRVLLTPGMRLFLRLRMQGLHHGP